MLPTPELAGSLKETVGRWLAAEYARCVPVALIRRAVDEAEELARTTEFPHLFLPGLAEEKVQNISTFLSRDDASPRAGQLQPAVNAGSPRLSISASPRLLQNAS